MTDQPSTQPHVATLTDIATMTHFAESRHAPTFVIETSGLVRYANPAAQQILGVTRDTRQSRLTDILDAESASAVQLVAKQTLATGRDDTIEIGFDERNWLCMILPLQEQTGIPHCVGMLCIDATSKEKKIQQQLASQKELTETLMKEFRHTLKNKLQGVVGILRQQQDQNNHCAEVIAKVITQLLAVSAVYGIEARVDEDRIYVCSIVNEVIRGIHSGVPLKPLQSVKQITLNDDHAVPIALVINELITNAVKHTPADPHTQILVSVETSPDQAQLRIFNSPAVLGDKFDLENGHGLGSGLQLTSALLPPLSSELSIRQQDNGVMATLTLRPPTVELSRATIDHAQS